MSPGDRDVTVSASETPTDVTWPTTACPSSEPQNLENAKALWAFYGADAESAVDTLIARAEVEVKEARIVVGSSWPRSVQLQNRDKALLALGGLVLVLGTNAVGLGLGRLAGRRKRRSLA